MGCNQNGFERMVIKLGNGIPTIPATDDHQDGSWLTTDLYIGEWYQDLDTDKVYMRTVSGITEILDSSGAPVTIYTGDGSLPSGSNRKFDLNTGKLFIYNGKVFFGTDDPEWLIPGFEIPVAFQFNGGLIAGNGGITCQPVGGGDGFLMNPGGDGNAYTARMDDSNTFGLNLKAGFNKIFDADIAPDPTNENSSILTIWSTRKGTIPFPRMTDAEMNAIVSPTIGLMVYVTDASDGIYVYKSSGWTLVA